MEPAEPPGPAGFAHVRHSKVHPKFLHSNSTSHRWAFGAIAELIDNAMDPDVMASQFQVELRDIRGKRESVGPRGDLLAMVEGARSGLTKTWDERKTGNA